MAYNILSFAQQDTTKMIAPYYPLFRLMYALM